MRKNHWMSLALVVLMVSVMAGCAEQADSQLKPNASPASSVVSAAAEDAAKVTPLAEGNAKGGSETAKITEPESMEPAYKDGTYELITEKDYENYYVKASLVIKDSRISDFHYDIYDANNTDALFDEQYEQYMGNEHYKQQCRDDLKGMKTYGPKLVETQSVDEVDVVTGATWTWKWFKQAANELLEKAAAQ